MQRIVDSPSSKSDVDDMVRVMLMMVLISYMVLLHCSGKQK